MSCICIAIIAMYLLFLPPPSYCLVDPATAVDAPVIDYVVDDTTPCYRATRQAVPLPLSQISPIYLYLPLH